MGKCLKTILCHKFSLFWTHFNHSHPWQMNIHIYTHQHTFMYIQEEWGVESDREVDTERERERKQNYNEEEFPLLHPHFIALWELNSLVAEFRFFLVQFLLFDWFIGSMKITSNIVHSLLFSLSTHTNTQTHTPVTCTTEGGSGGDDGVHDSTIAKRDHNVWERWRWPHQNNKMRDGNASSRATETHWENVFVQMSCEWVLREGVRKMR